MLAETVTAIAKNIWLYSVPELSALPPDLAQLVFDELLTLGKLTRSSLALFSNQHLYKLRLEDYPGVGNDWLKLLTSSPLLLVNLSRCIQVSLCCSTEIPENVCCLSFCKRQSMRHGITSHRIGRLVT